MLGIDLRDRREMIDAFVRRASYVLEPDRYFAVYAPEIADIVDEEEDGMPIDPSEFERIDQLLSELDSKRVAEAAKPLGPDEGWV